MTLDIAAWRGVRHENEPAYLMRIIQMSIDRTTRMTAFCLYILLAVAIQNFCYADVTKLSAEHRRRCRTLRSSTKFVSRTICPPQ